MTKKFQIDTDGTLTQGLVSYYKFEDVVDFCEVNDLTNYNSVTFSAGQVNNCAVPNGSSSYLRRAAVLSTATTNISMFMWIYVPTTSEKGGFFSNGGYQLPNWTGYALGVGNNLDTMDSTGNYLVGLLHGVVAKSFGSLGGAGWHFVGMTRDATTWRGYIDNVEQGVTFTDNPVIPNFHVTFGAANLDYASLPRWSNAKVDEFGFWNKVLSAQERADLYNNGSGQTMVEVESFIPTFNSDIQGIVIADVENYEFPSLCKADNGDLLMGCRHGLKSNLLDKGKATLFRSTDNGLTWDSGTVVAEHATYDVGSLSLTKLSNGRIIAIIWYGDTSTLLSVSILTAYSDDHGVTWSSFVAFSFGSFVECSALGHAFELNDGSVVFPYQAWDSHNSGSQQRLARSTNNGATFADYSLIVKETGAPVHYWPEASIVRLANGNLRAFIQDWQNDPGGIDWGFPTPTGNPTYKKWASCDSADEGVTWSAPITRFHASAFPAVIRTQSGKYIAAIGRRDSVSSFVYLPCARLSDDATNWGLDIDEIVIDKSITSGSPTNTDWYGSYSDVIEIQRGVFAFAYCAIYWPDLGSNQRGFIWLKYLDETNFSPFAAGRMI